jgi:hypothetical protein
MLPAANGQVDTAQREGCERRWAWRGPHVGRVYGSPAAGAFGL